MTEQIESLLAAIRRDSVSPQARRRITQLLDLWEATYPTPEPENAAWWQGQQAIAGAAPRVARTNWRGAMRLAGLIHEPLWQKKVRLCCQLELGQYAQELATTAPQLAVRIARRLNRQFRVEALLQIAIAIYPQDPRQALVLYREVCRQSAYVMGFLMNLVPLDWRTALQLAQASGLQDDNLLLSRIVERAAPEEFALAEELTGRIQGTSRFPAMEALLQHLPPLNTAEVLGLMERPIYCEHRIQIFAHYRSTIREFCGLPAEETSSFVRPDGEDPFWDFFRSVLKRTESDLPWALEQVRSVQDFEKRRFLFAYMDAEFCHAR